MSTPAAAAAVPLISAQPILLSAITPSPTNPRKHFDKTKLAELTENVRKHNVLMPVLVRSRPGGKFELVAGERRFRAATAAGLKEIPATVRDLSDAEVLEIQIVENIQRADLQPVEEADGYSALLKCKHADGKPYTVDDIAAAVGKSKSAVYAKLKLGDLCPEARAALTECKLSESVALLVARIPHHDTQRAAVKEFTRLDYNHEPVSYSARGAFDYIRRTFMLDLTRAKFPGEDLTLAPKAGACSKCPKRSGNQPDLQKAIGSADVCTDPKCFDGKTEAHTVRVIAKAKESGAKIIDGKAAQQLMPYSSSTPKGFVVVDETQCLADKNTTARKLLGKDLPPVSILINPHTKAPVEIVALADLNKAIKAKGLAPAPTRGASSPNIAEARRKDAAEIAIRRSIHLAVRDKFAAAGPGLDDLRVIVDSAWGRLWHEHRKTVARLWISDEPAPVANAKGKKNRTERVDKISALDSRIATMPGPDLFRLMLDCAMVEKFDTTRAGTDVELLAMAKRHGVNAAQIRSKGEAEYLAAKAEQKQKAKTKAKKAAQKSGTAAGKKVAAK